MDYPDYYGAVKTFLNTIGIPLVETKIQEAQTFLPGIYIDRGSLQIDTSRLKYVGDILHEAGHIACMPPSSRNRLQGDISEDMGEEIAAQAWSYAAAVACGIPAEVVFHSDGYKGSAEWLAEHYTTGGTAGVPLLQWFGLTKMPDMEITVEGVEDFPVMAEWIRPMDDPSTDTARILQK